MGFPGYPPSTQWKGSKIHVQRLWKRRHLLYGEAAGKGMSGSPLYFIDKRDGKALVVGIHVGGSETLGNLAVPISYHKKTVKTWIHETSSGKVIYDTHDIYPLAFSRVNIKFI